MADEDRELFEAALSDDKPEKDVVQPEPAPEQPAEEGQPRDEQGRFAPKVEEPEAQPPAVQQVQEPVPQEDRGGQIPAWRLKEEADARREAERRAQEYEQQVRDFQRQLQAIQAQQRQNQPQPEVPDIFENPQAYTSHIEQTMAARMREQELNFSLRMAHREYKGEFDEAYSALTRRGEMGDRATVQAIVASSDPGEALIRWHRQQKLYETTGGDIEAYKAKLREEMLKDPEVQKQVVEMIRNQPNGNGNGQRPVTQLPPSLSRVPSAAPAVDGDLSMSDEALFQNALR